jgi:formylglycine-generating enzyme required for sulfatase activity
VVIDLGGGVNLELVLIRPGSFTMGDDSVKPAHKVTLTQPFYLGKYEVTQEQWQAVMGFNPSHFKGPKNPVEMVTWDDCQSFLIKLNAKSNGYKFALPTEAQWEYACRAGSTTAYSFGDSEADLGNHAWYSANSEWKTHPVGQKKPNAWGLYDMHGNVWEWCADGYGNYADAAQTDPKGADSGSSRVLRGGAWSSAPQYCHSVYRHWLAPGYRHRYDGLRVVVSLPVSKTVKSDDNHHKPPAAIESRQSTSALSGDIHESVKTGTDMPGLKKDLVIDLGGGVNLELVLIRPGSFTMGDDSVKTAHKVTLTQPFYLGKYEVTQEQWQAVIGANPSHFKGPKNPVDNVSWNDCQGFLTKLNAKLSGYMFAFPTEAQWEYACRAGSTTAYSFGESDSDLGNYAWYAVNSEDKTHPVGQKKPNAWGLYDMHGNVWEWCADWHGNYADAAQSDPKGADSGSGRVLRGGSWLGLPQDCHSAFRPWLAPGNRGHYFGMRVMVFVSAAGTPE